MEAATRRAVVGFDGRRLRMLGDELVGCAAGDTVGAEVLVAGLILAALVSHVPFPLGFLTV